MERKTLELVRTASKSEVGCESVLSECVPGEFEELWVLEGTIPMLGGHGAPMIDQKEKGLSSAMSRDKAATKGSS